MIYLFSLIILLVIVISLSKKNKEVKRKSRYKGLSAEEMGTAHKNKKSRRERKRGGI